MEILSEYQKAQKFLEGFEWDDYPDADDHLATICEALQEIKEYKYLEEQGKLLKLPCAVEDAYDLNKVVEQLKRESIPENKILYADPDKFGAYVPLEKAIKIVKGMKE